MITRKLFNLLRRSVILVRGTVNRPGREFKNATEIVKCAEGKLHVNKGTVGTFSTLGTTGMLGTLGTAGTLGALGTAGTLGTIGTLGALGAIGTLGTAGTLGTLSTLGIAGKTKRFNWHHPLLWLRSSRSFLCGCCCSDPQCGGRGEDLYFHLWPCTQHRR